MHEFLKSYIGQPFLNNIREFFGQKISYNYLWAFTFVEKG